MVQNRGLPSQPPSIECSGASRDDPHFNDIPASNLTNSQTAGHDHVWQIRTPRG